MLKSKMPGLTQMTFQTPSELRLHEGYTQIKIELERKRRVENPTFEAADSDQFQPINYMFKVMPEFQKESYSAK